MNILSKKEILCTLGPSSMNDWVIKRLESLGVSLFRVNLSHTKIDDLPKVIRKIQRCTSVPICLDTEGAQIRTGNLLDGKVMVKENNTIRISKILVDGDGNVFNLNPVDIIDKLEVGDQPIIYGSGEQTIDMTFVTDVAKANILALKSDICGEVFNVASAEETSINQLLSYMQQNIRTDLKPIYKEHPGKTHVDKRQASIEKIKKQLGWQPTVSPLEGLKKLVEWKKEVQKV